MNGMERLTTVMGGGLPDRVPILANLLEQGREDLRIVQYGNGVHNKKYSIMLIDVAITSFEDLIDFLEEGSG